MEGSTFLLFHNLPYSFEERLPLPLSNGVLLYKTPTYLFEDTPEDYKYNDKEFRALVNYILPGYDLRDSGVNHSCLKTCKDLRDSDNDNIMLSFFYAITALRLWKPAYIRIAGRFTYKSQNDPINKFDYYGYRSMWNPDKGAEYKPQDIRMSEKINKLISSEDIQRYDRLNSSIILFSQITNGFILSYQLAYFGLFSVLEGLFCPNGVKAKTLSKRVCNFLASFNIDHDSIYTGYRTNRHQIGHGAYSVLPNEPPSEEKRNRFGYLHEVTRLCILGFLSMDSKLKDEIFSETGNKRQSALDSISAASGTFIESQKLYLELH